MITATEAKKTETRMVRVKAIRDFRVKRGEDFLTFKPNDIAELTEEEAKMFCDHKFETGYNGWGEGHYEQLKVARAVRA